jgi:glycylpeptide N-tetradecanoyltransferase
MTMSMNIKLHKLPETTATPGLRPMQQRDARQVQKLLGDYLAKFKLVPVMDEKEVAHWLLPRDGVMYSYVVEDPKSKGTVTGLTSFYCLPSSILGNAKHKTLMAAYSYYTFNLNGPVSALVKDALVLAYKAGFDVYNCLDVMENESFLKDLRFGLGDGKLQYYIYNWACAGIQPKHVGFVLL